VNHLDRQVHVYDLRQSTFNERPSLEFGHRDAGSKLRSVQYAKGSLDSARSLFGRGYYGDGSVHVWDYRNVKVSFGTPSFSFLPPFCLVLVLVSVSD
jgi:hypothetical protein